MRVGAFWKFVGQAEVQEIRLVTATVLVRLLAPADYGAAAVASDSVGDPYRRTLDTREVPG